MPKVTFYTHVAQPAAFACRLIARAIRDGGQILVWSDSAAAVQQLDVDLWQQIPESFIPHEVWLPTDPMPRPLQNSPQSPKFPPRHLGDFS